MGTTHCASLVAHVPRAVDRGRLLLSGAGRCVPRVAPDHALVVYSGAVGDAADVLLAGARPVYAVAPTCVTRGQVVQPDRINSRKLK